jgi:hypothetical protein
MLAFTLVSAVLLAGLTLIFSVAGTAATDGAVWATSLCSAAPLLCQAPSVMWVPAVALGASWVVLKMTAGIQI